MYTCMTAASWPPMRTDQVTETLSLEVLAMSQPLDVKMVRGRPFNNVGHMHTECDLSMHAAKAWLLYAARVN
jgi:hypothetical protein